MGIVLTPIITKDTIALSDLRGQTLAVDGNGELYQFLALIRLRDGTPLQDSKGRTTSHLSGLFYRTTRLMAEHGLKLVFDGAPPPKATMTSRLTREMIAEARELLRLMGVPTVQAPSEGEAQAAHMAATSPDIWAAASKAYDSLLFGAPRLVRFSLVGTDFNDGIKGIGAKKALKLVQEYGRIENMPEDIRNGVGEPETLDEVRPIFLEPDVTSDFEVGAAEPDLGGIVQFLCGEREFSRERVGAALERTFRERSLW